MYVIGFFILSVT